MFSRRVLCVSTKVDTYLLSWCHNPAAAWTPDCSDFEMLKQHSCAAECHYKSLWDRGGVWVKAALIGKSPVTQLQCLLLPLPSLTEWRYCECELLVWSGFKVVAGVFATHPLWFGGFLKFGPWKDNLLRFISAVDTYFPHKLEGLKIRPVKFCASKCVSSMNNYDSTTLHHKCTVSKLRFIVLGFTF